MLAVTYGVWVLQTGSCLLYCGEHTVLHPSAFAVSNLVHTSQKNTFSGDEKQNKNIFFAVYFIYLHFLPFEYPFPSVSIHNTLQIMPVLARFVKSGTDDYDRRHRGRRSRPRISRHGACCVSVYCGRRPGQVGYVISQGIFFLYPHLPLPVSNDHSQHKNTKANKTNYSFVCVCNTVFAPLFLSSILRLLNFHIFF